MILTTKEANKYISWQNTFIKQCKSDNYNWVFNSSNGFFKRWGSTKEEDPLFSPFGPELCDMEISTICSGPDGTSCPWCYKSNTPVGGNMSYETFKTIFKKLPHNVSQIAFGIGDIDGNPDLWNIMNYCRHNDHNRMVIPNITINGANLTEDNIVNFSLLCGSIAVSRYKHCVDVCYDAVKKLTDHEMKQVNIHQILSKDTIDDCFQVIEDFENDERLEKLNAVVFLLLKPKGKRNYLHTFDSEDLINLQKLVGYCLKNNISIGFDSCSTPWFLESLNGLTNEHTRKAIEQLVEPCESFGFFSSYINYEGKYFPCSFCEESHEDWMDGFDVLKCDDFLTDIWYSPLLNKWRNIMIERRLEGNTHCPIWNI